MKRTVFILAFLTTTVASQAQSSYMELLRADVRAQKVAIVTAAMELTPGQSDVFWPVYREYEAELAELGDEGIAIVQEYADSYETMDDEKAKKLTERNFKLQENKLKLRKKYFKNVEQALGGAIAARAVQVENQIGGLIDLQIAAELPLVEAAAEAVVNTASQ